MADLLIRYVNGRRVLAIDFRGPARLEQVLHDRAREQRVPISDKVALLGLTELMKLIFTEGLP